MSTGTPATPATPPVPESLGRQALVLAVIIGVIASLGAAAYLGIVNALQEYLWSDLPGTFGWTTIPAWWIFLLLLIGAAVVALAWRMPGATGEGPLTGLHFNVLPINAPSILLAAAGSLVFGIVLGPEAPLVILGTTLGALLLRGKPAPVVQLGMLLGGAAAIGLILGNPFVTAFMLLEFAAMGAMPAVALVPAFVALGTGYLVQIGVGAWSGLHMHALVVPGLPEYTHETFRDLFFGFIVAIVAGLLAVLIREFGEQVAAVAARHRAAVLFAVAVLTGVIAVVVTNVGDVGVNLILFSGENGMGDLLAQTSLATVVLVVVGKALAYGLALGGGFRGGPIFPATYLGVGVGLAASLLINDLSVSPMAAAAIAASVTVLLRLPFTSALLAMLLVGSAGAAVAPFAIIGAVIGFGMRQGLDRFDAKRQASVNVEGEVVHGS